MRNVPCLTKFACSLHSLLIKWPGWIARKFQPSLSLALSIDTSGSLDGEELKKIFTEIFSILKNTKFELTVIECDEEVQSVYKARNIDEINLDVNGRGGTSFEPVISYLNEKKEYRDAVLVYFTDGMGDDEISRHMVNRCLWVLTDPSEELSVKEPYGDVISIK